MTRAEIAERIRGGWTVFLRGEKVSRHDSRSFAIRKEARL